ncbi:hypothetical protein MtrunA17_Chr2g0323561 [Medicago truncatula]|uniref:Uncharacterized protein n=1 Tax=Medicago truncatula TaxID=3880 RepID=A0A396JG18_MEDTR|nr:hypothetical protein MtrunA17_Chr2g0323561 [Medicago truncatula]
MSCLILNELDVTLGSMVVKGIYGYYNVKFHFDFFGLGCTFL